MKNSIIKAVGVILCAAGLCGMLGGCSLFENPEQARREFEKHPHYLYVKTVTVPEKKDIYYDLNDHGDFRKCEAFEPNAVELYNLEGAIPDKVKKALDLVDDFEAQEKHQLSVDRVFLYEDKCFISVWYNVNWQVPYSLLEFDEESETLREIMYISDAEIVGLKV